MKTDQSGVDLGYLIRPGSAEHIPLLGAIERAAAAIFPPGSVPNFIYDDVTPPEYFAEALNSGNFWVALRCDEPVGYALLRYLTVNTGSDTFVDSIPCTLPDGNAKSTGSGRAEAKAVGACFQRTQVESSTIALLAQMDVLPEHGRRGLGRRLIAEVAAKARQDGYRWLYLTTFRNIPWNAPFYAGQGFVPVEDAAAPALIREILREERAAGLENRLAMRLKL